jgi:hypothetical protein
MMPALRSGARLQLRRLAAAGAALAAALALASCGSGQAAATLDSGRIERAIERSSLAQRGVEATVTCPSGVPVEEGLSFSCMATVEGNGTRFVVTQQDDAGQVRYEAP